MKKHGFSRQEFSAIHLFYTQEESPDRSFMPPTVYVQGKIRNLEAWWGRMEASVEGQYNIDVYRRSSTITFVEEADFTALTSKELGEVVPNQGDSLWIWSWTEERIKVGLIDRLHIEVESRKLSDII